MASRSIFNLQVARCPACRARLPVVGKEEIVTCEYCDARVTISRGSTPSRPRSSTPSPPSSAPRHVASAHYSAFAWGLAGLVALIGLGGALALFLGRSVPSFSTSVVVTGSSPVVAVAPTEVVASTEPAVVRPTGSSKPSIAAGRVEPARPPEPPSSPKASKPAKAPSGPVLSVAQAKAQLEPAVLACMRQTKTHALLAYMGNRSAGPVHLLRDSRTRIDGQLASLANTKLGRCIDDAGKTVRTHAVKSNYVRLQLRNDAVPDPLASLPAKADLDAVKAVIVAVEPKVHECARKHGQQGAREVFSFRIDGPSGKPLSSRGTYGSRAFRSCAEAIYRRLRFPKVQSSELKYTHAIEL